MIPTPRNAETHTQWVEQSWPNVRAYLDEVMKLTAMLPGAVNAWDDDGGDHFMETLGQLSTQLYCVDMWLGENPPGYKPPRPGQLGNVDNCQQPEPTTGKEAPEPQGFGLSRKRALEEVESNLLDARDHLFAWLADADNFADGIVRTRLSELCADVYVAIESLEEARRADR